MPVMLAAHPDPTLRPTLRVIDVVAIIVGTVVGAGIFRTPSLVAANATSEAAALGAWVAGGAISLIGALCYAELAAAYPSPGGDYHYLGRAFGIRLAFLFAWARITVIQKRWTSSCAEMLPQAGQILPSYSGSSLTTGLPYSSRQSGVRFTSQFWMQT